MLLSYKSVTELCLICLLFSVLTLTFIRNSEFGELLEFQLFRNLFLGDNGQFTDWNHHKVFPQQYLHYHETFIQKSIRRYTSTICNINL